MELAAAVDHAIDAKQIKNLITKLETLITKINAYSIPLDQLTLHYKHAIKRDVIKSSSPLTFTFYANGA